MSEPKQYWCYSFKKVRRVIVPSIGTFRMFVRNKQTGERVGMDGPYFMPQEFLFPGVDPNTEIKVLLLGYVKGDELYWEVVSEHLGVLGEELVKQVILEPPELVPYH